MSGSNPLDGLFTHKVFATASLRTCDICGHAETYRFTGGHRGAGMVGGNKARGRIIQHIKEVHPLTAAKYRVIVKEERAVSAAAYRATYQ